MSAHYNLVTTGVVAEHVGIPRSRLVYLLESQQVPGPSHQVPGRRLFTKQDVTDIERTLRENPALRRVRKLTSLPIKDGGSTDGLS